MIHIWCSKALSIWQIDGRTLLSFRQDTTRRSYWLSDCSNNNIMSRITVAAFWLKIFEIKQLRDHNRLGNQSFLVFLVKFWYRTSFCLRGKSLKTTTLTERDGTGRNGTERESNNFLALVTSIQCKIHVYTTQI